MISERPKTYGNIWIEIIKAPDYADGELIKALSIVITNEKSYYTLPEAGGEGTSGYMTGGMSLMVATLLMYITWQYMCNKGKRGASK